MNSTFSDLMVAKKRIVSIIFSGFLLFGIQTAFAQKPGKSQSFGIGVDMGVSPNVGTTQFACFGITARYSILAGPGYAYVGTGLMVSRAALDFQIPVRLGYKFIFAKQYFVSGELGYYIYKNPDDDSYGSSSGLSIAPSFGVQFGVFDLAIRYYGIINNDNLSTLGISFGWNF